MGRSQQSEHAFGSRRISRDVSLTHTASLQLASGGTSRWRIKSNIPTTCGSWYCRQASVAIPSVQPLVELAPFVLRHDESASFSGSLGTCIGVAILLVASRAIGNLVRQSSRRHFAIREFVRLWRAAAGGEDTPAWPEPPPRPSCQLGGGTRAYGRLALVHPVRARLSRSVWGRS